MSKRKQRNSPSPLLIKGLVVVVRRLCPRHLFGSRQNMPLRFKHTQRVRLKKNRGDADYCSYRNSKKQLDDNSIRRRAPSMSGSRGNLHMLHKHLQSHDSIISSGDFALLWTEAQSRLGGRLHGVGCCASPERGRIPKPPRRVPLATPLSDATY
jgi:hypothetical protein